MTTSSGSNFTGLYGSSTAVIPSTPYGNANVVGLLAAGTDGGNTVTAIVATGNISTTAQISATGNITTAGYFVGSVIGNVSGNIAAAGSNTQVQFNNNGVLGADADFTFDSATNTLTSANISGTSITGSNVTGTQINTNSLQGNAAVGNLVIRNSFSGSSSSAGANILADAQTLLVGSVNTGLSQNAVVQASLNNTLQLTTTNSGAPSVYVGKYVSGNPTYSGNIDAVSSNVGGYAGTGNINLSGNVYVSRNGQGANTTYGKANLIVSDNIESSGVISATGNIITDSYFVGEFVGNITGNISVPGLTTQVLWNNAGNVGASSGLTFTAASNALVTSGTVSAAGNITGAYILGNGSQLTGLPATYSNAQVSSYLASGTNTANIITTGNIAVGNISIGNSAAFDSSSVTLEVGGWNAVPRGRVLSTNFSPNQAADTVSFILPGTSTGPADANIAAGNILSFGSMQSSTITANGNVIAGNVNTGGQISASGNITGNYYIGNGSQLTGIVATSTYGNANVSAYLASGTNSANIVTTGNIEGGNIYTIGTIQALGTFEGDGSGLFTLNGSNVSGTVDLATYVVANNQGNINTVGTLTSLSVTGNIVGSANITGANLITSGLLSVTGNANVGNVNTGNVIAVGYITATGNINGANLVASANLTSTQQTVIGTANVGTTGNIVISGKNIATDMQWNPDGGNAATGPYGRIVVGTGFGGNISHSAQQNRLVVADSLNRSNTATTVRSFNAEQYVTLTGNVVQNNFRQQGLGGYVRVGGGASANTASSAGSTAGVPFLFASGQFNLDIGNFATYNLGNTTISHATLNGGALTVGGNSSVGNAFGIYNLINNTSATANAYGNIIGYSSSIAGGATGSPPSGNVYAFYHPATTATYGPSTSATVQAAPQYYAFYNADDHAQVRLGSLRSYNEYRYSTATSGTVNIDKSNAQVQYIAPTGNVTIGSFQNFVTQTVTTYETDNQVDTVTLIVQQGATPYTVTMPTGNAAIKYANAVSTVGSTANSVTMISITSYYTGSATGYLVTVSPEFT